MIQNRQIGEAIDACAKASLAGQISFGEAVGRLVGLESYFADYRAGCTTYYLPSGETHSVALHSPDIAVADAFDLAGVRAAIGGAQRGEVVYPEFVERTMRSGCAGYQVFIAGRHVRYFGRRGESHVDEFPGK